MGLRTGIWQSDTVRLPTAQVREWATGIYLSSRRAHAAKGPSGSHTDRQHSGAPLGRIPVSLCVRCAVSACSALRECSPSHETLTSSTGVGTDPTFTSPSRLGRGGALGFPRCPPSRSAATLLRHHCWPTTRAGVWSSFQTPGVSLFSHRGMTQGTQYSTKARGTTLSSATSRKNSGPRAMTQSGWRPSPEHLRPGGSAPVYLLLRDPDSGARRPSPGFIVEPMRCWQTSTAHSSK